MVELREETGVRVVELDRETGEEQITVGWTRRWPMKDYRRERQSYVSRAGGDKGIRIRNSFI